MASLYRFERHENASMQLLVSWCVLFRTARKLSSDGSDHYQARSLIRSSPKILQGRARIPVEARQAPLLSPAFLGQVSGQLIPQLRYPAKLSTSARSSIKQEGGSAIAHQATTTGFRANDEAASHCYICCYTGRGQQRPRT